MNSLDLIKLVFFFIPININLLYSSLNEFRICYYSQQQQEKIKTYQIYSSFSSINGLFLLLFKSTQFIKTGGLREYELVVESLFFKIIIDGK